MSTPRSYTLRDRGVTRGSIRVTLEENKLIVRLRGGSRRPFVSFDLTQGLVVIPPMDRSAAYRAVINRFFDLTELPYEVTLSGAGWGRSGTLYIRNKDNGQSRSIRDNHTFGVSGRQYRIIVDRACRSDGELVGCIRR